MNWAFGLSSFVFALNRLPHRPAVLVVRADVVEPHQFRFPLRRVKGEGVRLLGIPHPGAEGVPVPLVLRHAVGGADGDHRDDLLLLGHLGHRERPGRADDPEQEVDTVLLDVPLRQVHRFLDVRLVVGGKQLELLPEDAALRVDLLDGLLRAKLAPLPEVFRASRQGIHPPQLDRVRRGRRGRQHQQHRYRNCRLPHSVPPSPFDLVVRAASPPSGEGR